MKNFQEYYLKVNTILLHLGDMYESMYIFMYVYMPAEVNY